MITINVAEADDVYREEQHTQQSEPYRALLGHFRDESGHYYWDRPVQDSPRLEPFRTTFGHERAAYQQALKRHYEQGPSASLEQEFISAYASSHPWEDWAESWAHMLHITNAIETAHSMGLSVKPQLADEPSLQRPPQSPAPGKTTFDQLVQAWLSLTYVLNNWSRGLGLPESFPFVLSPRVIDRLRFVFETMAPLHP